MIPHQPRARVAVARGPRPTEPHAGLAAHPAADVWAASRSGPPGSSLPDRLPAPSALLLILVLSVMLWSLLAAGTAWLLGWL